jgi:Calcineurin-like phosphoesterase
MTPRSPKRTPRKPGYPKAKGMNVTGPQLAQFQSRLMSEPELLRANVNVFQYLRASEYLLIQLMIRNNVWTGPRPPEPGGKGALEFGLICRWVNHPPKAIQEYIDGNKLVRKIWEILKGELPTRIDDTNYNNLITAVDGGGLIGDDGTLIGEKTYEQLDPLWFVTILDDVLARMVGPAHFVENVWKPVPLSGGNPNQVSIALVGEWGTGDYPGGPAIAIMKQIEDLKPDYVIHLGDVYYAGTNGDFIPPGEEQNNFLNYWSQKLRAGNSFTLNSNHEMYSGAHGYFGVALRDQRFKRQNKCSYFALQYAGWTILGLDSAYYSPSALYMQGSIGGVTGLQGKWIAGMGLSPSRVIVLSHHNGLSYDGATEEILWQEVSSALKGDPAAWYWGHVHNGIVYKTPTVTGKKTRARCAGHGALPFGDAWGLAGSPRIDYYAHTPNPDLPKRVFNGFAMLTIRSSGTVDEAFYEQNRKNSVWSSNFQGG